MSSGAYVPPSLRNKSGVEGARRKTAITYTSETRKFMTNDAIERRRQWAKYGDEVKAEKGDIKEMVFPSDDKEVYLERPNQPRLEDAIPRFKKELGIPDYTRQIEDLERKLIYARTGEFDVAPVVVKTEGVEEQPRYHASVSIRMSNLPEITEDELRELLAPLYKKNKIKRLHMPISRDTNMYRDFAFVHFETLKDAQEAIAMFDGKKVDHTVIKVEMAEEPRNRRPPQQRPR